MWKKEPVPSTVVAALERLAASQRALAALDLLYRRELTERVRARNAALVRAAAHHVPVEELAAAARLSESYVRSLLRRGGRR